MWLSFSADVSSALKIGVGKVCAVSGRPWSNTLSQDPQNYVAVPLRRRADPAHQAAHEPILFCGRPPGAAATRWSATCCAQRGHLLPRPCSTRSPPGPPGSPRAKPDRAGPVRARRRAPRRAGDRPVGRRAVSVARAEKPGRRRRRHRLSRRRHRREPRGRRRLGLDEEPARQRARRRQPGPDGSRPRRSCRHLAATSAHREGRDSRQKRMFADGAVTARRPCGPQAQPRRLPWPRSRRPSPPCAQAEDRGAPERGRRRMGGLTEATAGSAERSGSSTGYWGLRARKA
jgi:hypothetical protein